MKTQVTLIFLIACSGVGMAQVPNNGMEIWSEAPQLMSWTTNSYPQTLPPYEPYIVRKDPDAHSGEWCANFYANGVMKPWAHATFAIGTAHPEALQFWYKLNFPPCVNDSGFAEQDTVSLRVELLDNGNTVDVGYWESTISQLEYSMVTVPISQDASVFNECKVTITGGRVFGGCGFAMAPTEFRIDDLSLIFPEGDCIDPDLIDLDAPCPEIFDPVCGCNHVTYSNACEAQNYGGVTSWTAGSCSGCVAHFSYNNGTTDFQFYDESISEQSTYQWDFGDGETSTDPNPTHNYTQPGWYSVCLIISGFNGSGQACSDMHCEQLYANDGCVDSSLICDPSWICCDAPFEDPVCGCDGETYINSCVASSWYGVMSYSLGACDPSAIRDRGEDNLFRIFPNPNNGQFSIQLSRELNDFNELMVFDMSGKLADHHVLSSNSGPIINLDTQLSQGIYLLELRSGRIASRQYIIIADE